MSSLKLSVKLDRGVYKTTDFSNKLEWQNRIRATFSTLLDSLKIPVIKIYNPDWDSMKVLFADEKKIDLVFRNSEKLKDKGFEARLPMALKAQRTVVIHSFDMALTETHSPQQIADMITSQGWSVKQVFVLRSKRAFKIQLSSKEETKKFFNQKEVAIGPIRIYQKSFEEEINPCINQCWKCGEINPGHTKETCKKPQVCLKCCSREHQIFECQLPRETESMSPYHRSYVFCVPCKSGGDHCSLDHKLCPTKRRVLQERIQEARQKKIDEEKKDNRDQQLAEKTAKAIATASGFPALPTLSNDKQLNLAAIITLALLEDAVIEGSFQECLTKACIENNLPQIKYKPNHETSVNVFRAICSPNYTAEKPQTEKKNNGSQFAVPAPPRSNTSTTQRWVNDNTKAHNKRSKNSRQESDADGESSMDESGRATVNNYSKKTKKHIIAVNTSATSLDSTTPSPANLTLTSLKTAMDDAILKFLDNSTREANKGLKNFTITELHKIISSKECINSPEWKRARTKETSALLKANHGLACILANFETNPVVQDFQPTK